MQKSPPPPHLADHRLIYAALKTLHLSFILLGHFVRTVLFFHCADDEARPLLEDDSSAPRQRPFSTDGWGGGTETLHKNVSEQKEEVTLLCVLSGRTLTGPSEPASTSDGAEVGTESPVSSYMCVECI